MSQAHLSVGVIWSSVGGVPIGIEAGDVAVLHGEETADPAQRVLDVAELFGVPTTDSRRKLLKLVGDGAMPWVRVGATIELQRSDLPRVEPVPRFLRGLFATLCTQGVLISEDRLALLLDPRALAAWEDERGG